MFKITLRCDKHKHGNFSFKNFQVEDILNLGI